MPGEKGEPGRGGLGLSINQYSPRLLISGPLDPKFADLSQIPREGSHGFYTNHC